MNSGGAKASGRSRNQTLRVIASSRRRAVLGCLLDRGTPVTEHELATTLAAAGRDESVTDVSAADLRAARGELAQVHLPALSDVGLVTRDRADGTVGTTSHPALYDPRFRRLLAVDDGFDAVLSHLARQHRRVVLTTLRDARRPMSREEFARELLRREAGTAEPEPAMVGRVVASLYHVHLPKLADDGLVEYDRETGRTAYADHPALEKVLGIIHEPERHLLEKFDGFLCGMKSSYRQVSRDANEPAGWPHFWGDPYYG